MFASTKLCWVTNLHWLYRWVLRNWNKVIFTFIRVVYLIWKWNDKGVIIKIYFVKLHPLFSRPVTPTYFHTAVHHQTCEAHRKLLYLDEWLHVLDCPKKSRNMFMHTHMTGTRWKCLTSRPKAASLGCDPFWFQGGNWDGVCWVKLFCHWCCSRRRLPRLWWPRSHTLIFIK